MTELLAWFSPAATSQQQLFTSPKQPSNSEPAPQSANKWSSWDRMELLAADQF